MRREDNKLTTWLQPSFILFFSGKFEFIFNSRNSNHSTISFRERFFLLGHSPTRLRPAIIFIEQFVQSLLFWANCTLHIIDDVFIKWVSVSFIEIVAFMSTEKFSRRYVKQEEIAMKKKEASCKANVEEHKKAENDVSPVLRTKRSVSLLVLIVISGLEKLNYEWNTI